MTDWKREDFARRRYTVEGGDLDRARRIEVLVRIDGRTLVHMQAREPGLVAFVSKPADQGFDIEVVEATAGKYADHALPDDTDVEVAEWQYGALKL